MPLALRPYAPPSALLVLALALAACRAEPRQPQVSADDAALAADAARDEFFENLAALCGGSYPGTTELASAPDHPQPGEPLVMHVLNCEPDELRIPFQVGDDTSRTWVISRRDGGLLFKHDHRHEDGTPEDITDYGGWADEGGTATRQHFPADSETAEMLPEAATNVWTLEFQDGRFIYDLRRHDQPRFRAVFDLNRPVP